jgi:hypothetical protein
VSRRLDARAGAGLRPVDPEPASSELAIRAPLLDELAIVRRPLVPSDALRAKSLASSSAEPAGVELVERV